MENIEPSGKISGGSNTELEKFKRRLIRAVARMLVHEKRNEEEVWVGLKKETGCDCREIWNRMYAVTVKKLERLFNADDHVKKLPKAARMTITDWLMFDTVLVHDDINLIGMTETTMEDRKTLVDLFDLVETHKIEFLAGDGLTDAWLRVTLQYNRDNRQCTPMLLQRRWYQLKLATRVRFYKFWSIYRGAEKRMHLSDPYKPTPLQATIAKRYKPLVVAPFMLWEDLVKNHLVILPEAFELKGNITPSAKSDDVSPDVTCVEPSVETINLDDSDTELEYRSDKSKNDQPVIKIKQEPQDDDDNDVSKPYKSRQEKILQFAEAVMEATANELDEMELSNDIDNFLSPDPEKVQSPLNEQDKTDEASDAVEPQPLTAVETDITPLEIENNTDATVTSKDDSITVIEETNTKTSNITSPAQDTTKDVCVEKAVNDNEIIVAPVLDDDIEFISATEPVVDVDSVEDISTVEDISVVDNDVEVLKEPEPVLPQITSVFGGVDVDSNESLTKIGLLTAQITNNSNIILDTTPQLDVANDAAIELCNDSSDISNKDVLPDDTHVSKSNCEMDEKISKDTWFGELSNDIDFADDGIQIIEDDYVEDEVPYPMPIDTKRIKTEVKNENYEIGGEQNKEDKEGIVYIEDEEETVIDEKLLLVAEVKVLKLDDMGILPIDLLNHIDNKSLIEVIASKNRPIRKVTASVNIKQELDSDVPLKPFTQDNNSSINMEINQPFTIKEETDLSGLGSDVPLNVKIKPPLTITQENNVSINTEINQPVTIKEEIDRPESSDEDVIDDSKKVKLSSRLLSKPRNRTYHPIQLCKNPDFNTRLKKLNVGFFSSARNILLLKSCQPLSIDVSKSFENKLVNGTMYLLRSDKDDIKLDTQPKEYSHNVSVMPSAMIVQSLIDNTQGDIPPASYSPIPFQPNQLPSNCQRNKVINLPDISEIRRINQKLLTAEVTPLRSKNDPKQVPVSLVTTARGGRPIPGPASRKKTLYPTVVDITKTVNKDKDDLPTKNSAITKDNFKPKLKATPMWLPKYKAQKSWFSVRNGDYSDDTLLALDTLNKMLFLISEDDATPQCQPVSSGKGKKKKSNQNKGSESTRQANQNKETESTSSSVAETSRKDDGNDDVQIVSETNVEDNTAKKSKRSRKAKAKPSKVMYCCWARERICQLLFSKKLISKHNCPFPLCLCCCKSILIEYIKKRDKQATKTANKQALERSTSKTEENSSEDVAIIDDNDVQDVVEIIPVSATITDISAADTMSGKETVMSTIDTAINTVVEMSVTENENNDPETSTKDSDTNNPETSTKDSDTNITTREVAVNTNEDIPTNEITVNTDTEIVANKSPVDTVCSDDPNRATDCQISDTLDDTTIGADIFVTTSNDKSLTQNYPIKVTSESRPSHKTYPAIKPTPRIRIKSSTNKHDILEAKRLQLNEPSTSGPRKVLFTNPSKNMHQEIAQNSQNASFIDATGESNTTKAGFNQKMLYLNSKQISELPNDNPICLGKNKILLTTAIFPPNFKAFEAFQANIRQTLALPKGIQLILLPSGRLTYLRDRKKFVSAEFMATLPKLIEAIQQQINGNIETPTNNHLQSEVIDLSDDETQNVIVNTEQTVNVETDKCHTNSTVDAFISETASVSPEESTTAAVDVVESTTAAVDVVESTTAAVDVEESTTAVVDVEESTTAAVDVEESTTATVILKDASSVLDVNITELNAALHTSHTVHPKESNTVDDVITTSVANNVESVTSDVNTVEKNSGKCNNILSDLMAMSGIDATDVTTTQESSQVETTPTYPLTSTEESIVPMLPPMNTILPQNNSVPLVPKGKGKNMLSQLTPITSLSELKYACAQSSTFFKLDLNTRLLLPINVCMKKFTEIPRLAKTPPKKSETTETLIDLTEDDVSVATDVPLGDPKSLLVTNQQDEFNIDNVEANITYDVDTYFEFSKSSSQSDVNTGHEVDPNVDGYNISKDGRVRPLKLFKSLGAHSDLPVSKAKGDKRPNILVRKLNEINKRLIRARIEEESIRRKLKRKQDFKSQSAVERIQSPKAISSDDSSDEEPLAKKATKMRALENIGEVTENINEKHDEVVSLNNVLLNNENNSSFDNEIECIDDLPDTVDEQLLDAGNKRLISDSNINEPMDEDEDNMTLEYLDETVLSEAEPDDDCILGV